LNILDRFLKNSTISYSMKTLFSEGPLVFMQMDSMKQIAAYCNFANPPKNKTGNVQAT
jgi:hypothetical protein